MLRVIVPLACLASVTACGAGETGSPQSGTDKPGTDTSEIVTAANTALPQNVALTGAGATFPAPLYQNWFVQLNKDVPKLQVNYQSVGSGAGVEQFSAGTVDFGASDVAMKDEEIAKVSKGVLLLPMTAGSIVLAYNVPGVEGLKLSREAYVDILLGKIKKWNDPKIASINPDLKLPDKVITVVHRSDGSGTTGVFTKHLSSISPEWKEKVGDGKTVSWPASGSVGAKGNEGVTAQIQQTEGAIGYIEYGYAKNNNLTFAALENQSKKYIEATPESASATLDAVVLPDNLRAFITDPEGADSYPIVSYTWLLAYKTYDAPEKAKAMEIMIQNGLTKGQEMATTLGYVPLPPKVREKVAIAADAISPDYKLTLK
ncbi:MAG: phosphate ABC transporter substrate-binding protein PstS [Acaryochloridaceae cyanobacterium CSU_5_19]|nr:phosphate ABC transporter substrate-binding protein PstS [Acaryochloridaceae cyanobacterium CSU_5_19]